MYVEKTTAEERAIIGSKVESLIMQFDTCQTLLQDIVENDFKFNGKATECGIDPDLLCNRLWIISNLMSDIVLHYHLMMGNGEYGAVQIHLEGVDTARKAIAEEDARRQEYRRKLEMRVGK